MQKIIKHSNKFDHSIIFVHGFPLDHKMWKYQINNLVENYNCISYDIRGLGESSARDGQFTLEDLVDDLFNVVSETCTDKPVICGLSMGGYICLRAFEREENKFSGLILCDTKSEADSNQVKLGRAVSIRQINNEGVSVFAGEFVPGCFTPSSFKTIEEDYLEILERSKLSDSKGVKGCLLAMAGRTDTTGYLDKIKIPVLVLCGEDDSKTPPAVMKAMAKKIYNKEFHIIKDAGHLSPVENPGEVNKYIEGFLKKVFG